MRFAEVYNQGAFEQAMAVVLAHAAYLPSAACFALLPLVAHAPRTGDESGALLDYDLQRERVAVTATRPYRCRHVILCHLSCMVPASLHTRCRVGGTTSA